MGTSPTSDSRLLGWSVLLAVASRPLLEVAWTVDVPIPGANLTRASTLAVTAALLAVAASRTWDLRGHALAPPLAAWGVLLVVGLVRAHELLDGLAVAVRYGSGIAVAAAGAAVWSRRHARALPLALLGGAAVPVLWSWVDLTSPNAWTELHGSWRFVGPWRVLHAHAIAMGTIAGIGLSTALVRSDRWRWAAAVMGGAACVPLVASATRSGVVLAAVMVLASLVAARRWRHVGVAAVVVVGVVIGVPTLRERFSEVAWAAVGVPPEEGWAWLGTGRLAIWTRSLGAWLALPADDILLGTGLGGYHDFWKQKEPHSELLALLYQHGPAGPVVAAWAGWTALRGAWHRARRHRDPEERALGAVATGVIVGTGVASLLGSTLLVRLTLSWACWAFAAVATDAGEASGLEENFRR